MEVSKPRKRSNEAPETKDRLSDQQWESLRSKIEHYMSRGWDEARIYWPNGDVLVAPIRTGKRERA